MSNSMATWSDRERMILDSPPDAENMMLSERYNATKKERQSLYREAWKATPLNIQKEILVAIEASHIGRAQKGLLSNRFYYVAMHLDGRCDEYREAIVSAMEYPERVLQWRAESAAADAKRAADREAKRQESMTPEAIQHRQEAELKRQVERLRKAMEMFQLQQGESTQQRSSTCSCCHRALTDPVSQQRGVGPECWGRLVSAGVRDGSLTEAGDHPDWLIKDIQRAKRGTERAQRVAKQNAERGANWFNEQDDNSEDCAFANEWGP